MSDTDSPLAGLHRPRLLIRAARFGMADYRRTPSLRRMFAAAGAHAQRQIVALLLRREDEADQLRRAGDATYSVARHVDLLIALMAEARLLTEAQPMGAAPRTAARVLPLARPRRPERSKGPGAAAPRLETKSIGGAVLPWSLLEA
ncbi:MAG: DUF6477 family protein [Alkalilacustris sp.]